MIRSLDPAIAAESGRSTRWRSAVLECSTTDDVGMQKQADSREDLPCEPRVAVHP